MIIVCYEIAVNDLGSLSVAVRSNHYLNLFLRGTGPNLADTITPRISSTRHLFCYWYLPRESEVGPDREGLLNLLLCQHFKFATRKLPLDLGQVLFVFLSNRNSFCLPLSDSAVFRGFDLNNRNFLFCPPSTKTTIPTLYAFCSSEYFG